MARKPRPDKWLWVMCQKCESIFRTYPHRIAEGRAKFCSHGCSYQVSYPRHGESRTRLHGIWCHMKTRCFCETSNAYEYYGGRGITVCDEWRDSFEVFRDWAMANGYSEVLELDRKEVNGNYEPGNCRWATRKEQMRNTRKRCDAKTSRFKGVSLHRANHKWRVQICGRPGIKSTHVGLFETEEEAAREYDRIMRTEFKGFAVLNFPTQG